MKERAMKCLRFVIRGLAVAFLSASISTSAFAQLSGENTANRELGIGELTDEQIIETLKNEGRVAISGAFFTVDSATLNESAQAVLDKLAGALNAAPDVRLAVVGHTDDTGSFDHNIALSEKRAQAVVAALEGKPHGIARERLVALGIGPIMPVASNLSEEGRALNRRVTLVLIK
jgi:outer membrane protein OmpA-like peptidoglycan-associated protein